MSQPIVLVEDVAKSFGTVTALEGVSLQIEPGIVYALLGPNGAGKTTLIRILTTLLLPDRGRAQVAGVDVLADPAAVRTRIGLAGQYAAVDEYLTGFENLEMIGRLSGMSRRQARQRAGEVLERIDLTDAADRQVRTYSGGMRRRLDLAASMMGKPTVLFLDEPTTGVDPRSRIDLWDLIGELVSGGTTLLLTTQYLEEADRLADRIGVIDEGRLIAQGTADELKTKVGGDVVELHVKDEWCDAARQLLAAIAGEEPGFDHRSGRLTIPAHQGPATLLEVVRHLDAAGIVPDDIALHKPTLDDVFLALTGRTAEDGPGEQPAAANPRRRRPQ
jgi:ABC-2 type transport system ATP-binding protein